MINNILELDLREKAGSDAYNRFEYQVHWIVHHILEEYNKHDNKNYLFLCEFHDDMAKLNCGMNPDKIEFFQVKTASKANSWTLSTLSKRNKKRSGELKNSFLGFLFINFLNFSEECSKCHFVSNIGVSKDVKKWQAIIQDKRVLKEDAPEVYSEIFSIISEEFKHMDSKEFRSHFDMFIQNTFVYSSELPLTGYEKAIQGEFFKMLSCDDVYTSSSFRVLNDLIEEVRKKSKKIIEIPISFEELKEKKGINTSFIGKIKEGIVNSSNEELYKEVKEFLDSKGVDALTRNIILAKLKEHHRKMIDVTNLLYIDNVSVIEGVINDVVNRESHRLGDISYIIGCVERQVKTMTLNMSFSKLELEAILYAKFFQ